MSGTAKLSLPLRTAARRRSMSVSVGAAFAGLLLGLTAPAGAQGTASPPVAPLTPSEKRPQAVVSIAPTRFNDLMWENDRAAFRIYSRDLEAAEPPSSSGIDAWGKKVRYPFMVRQLGRNYHADSGEGLDFYSVGTSRGAGGLGIWHDNKLWTSRNYAKHRILQSGGSVASFEVSYAPWPVDVVRKVWEERRFSLPMGTNFTRMVSTIRSDRPEELLVGIGIHKFGTSRTPGKLTVDRERGMMSVWSEGTAEQGAMGVAVLVDPASFAEVKQDSDNYLLLIRAQPGKPFVYYTGAAWSRGPDFTSQAAWEGHVRAQRLPFDAAAALRAK
jgi:hypothetical protein